MIDRTDPRWIADERARGRNFADFRARFRAIEAAKASGDTLMMEEPTRVGWVVVKDGQEWNWNSEGDAARFLQGASEKARLQREVSARDEEMARLAGQLAAAHNEIARLRATKHTD